MSDAYRLRSTWAWWTCLLLACWLAAPAAAFNVVVIDPGHGGVDRGTRWYKMSEKTLTLDVSKRVETLLRAKGVTTVMTRRTDKTVSLDQRAAAANRYRNSLMVSIHFNACTNTSIKGFETFYRSARGKKVAESIQRSLVNSIPGTNRGVRNAKFAVLTRTRGLAVLVECGFISNKAEAGRCGDPKHRQKLAEAIARGILRARG